MVDPESAIGVSIPLSGDPRIDGGLSTHAWNTGNLTYAFPTSSTFYPISYSTASEHLRGFSALTEAQMVAVRASLDFFASVTNLTFAELDPSAGYAAVDLAFGNSSAPDTAWAYYPSAFPAGGDVWFGTDFYDYTDPELGTYAWHTVMHEIGHSLGLKHGHEAISSNFVTLPYELDSQEFSIMTYRSFIGDPLLGGYTYEEFGAAQTPMMLDIAALQYMYGANYTTNSDATTYSFSPTTGEMFINGIGQGAPGSGDGGSQNRIFRTIWDGGGIDTYDFSAYGDDQFIDLTPGGWSLLSAAQLSNLGGGNLARGNVFNALLHEGDIRSLIENARGGSGDDFIIGNQAANLLDGGSGFDTASYRNSSAAVKVSLLTGFVAGGHAAGDAFLSIEALEGSRYGDRLVGNTLDNILRGLMGGDSLNGNLGLDIACYTFSPVAVNVSLLTGYASGGHAYGDSFVSIEGLSGSANDDFLSGNGVANRLFGGAGDDLLRGRGGADALDGGSGTDVANYSDSTAAVNISLLTGYTSGGHATGDTFVSIEGITGSSLNDVLVGNHADNLLEGRLGADRLNGSLGRDTASYASANAGVSVSLLTGFAAGGHAKGDTFVSIENLQGSAFADVLHGDNASNVLEGLGGADRLNGIGGIDTASYAHSDEGVDASLSTGFGTGGMAEGDTYVSIENLSGSIYDDVLSGNGGNNVLEGGRGADVLSGNGGSDTVSYANSDAGVTVFLRRELGLYGDAQGDTLVSIENIVGTAYNDTLEGTEGSNRLEGGRGFDVIYGEGGSDVFVYGDHFGKDTIFGYGSDDLLDFSSSTLVNSLADLIISVDGTNALVSDAFGNVITLVSQFGSIDASDFIF